MAVRRSLQGVLGSLGAIALCSQGLADVRMPAIMSDHMVLQHDGEARIWGWADPGELVTVEWKPEERVHVHATYADPDGKWEAWLSTPNVRRHPDRRGPYSIAIKGNNTVIIDDVLVGEVWVASGQSNMQMTIDRTTYGVENYEQELDNANYPEIRFFQVQRAVSPSPLNDCVGEWKVCTPETIGPFSAVAYFFGESIHKSQSMPVGLIGTYWGGTVLEAWMSPEGLVDFPEFHSDLSFAARIARDPEFGDERFAQQLSEWETKLGEADPGSKDAAYAQADLDDSGWGELTLPGLWDGEPGFENFDGFVWYRREFAIAEGDWGPSRLTLGAIDDMDAVWINGTLVGKTDVPGRWQQPRQYTVPGGILKSGSNVIAIRVLDTGGAGGLTGSPQQMAISMDAGWRERSVSLAGVWRAQKGAAAGSIPRMPQRPQMHQNRPTALSNAMVEPVTPYTIRGAIWYQGESNRTRARQYRDLMPAMIRDWRRRWGIDMPFYLVQIAPFGYGGDTGQAAELREAQWMTMDAIEGVGVAVTMDLGNPRDIHPKAKRPVGERLARWALAKVYGEDIEFTGPVVRGVELSEGQASIALGHAGGLEMRHAEGVSLFELAGADGEYVRADSVELRRNTIIVHASGIGEVKSVRYAWGPADAGVVFNGDGLPMSSFRYPIP